MMFAKAIQLLAPEKTAPAKDLTPYAQGFEAGADPFAKNPHPATSVEWTEWERGKNDGWLEAQW